MAQNKPISDKITRIQERAIAALLTSPTTTAAAEKAGVARSTLNRWLGDPTFKRAYRQARRELYDSVLAKLPALAGDAVEQLRTILTSPKTVTRDRLTAIRLVLENASQAQVVDMTELYQRLEETLQRYGGA